MKKSKKDSETNWSKVDKHPITQEEYDDIPELDDAWFDQADFHVGGTLVRRGRPKGSGKKVSTTVRFDADILEYFKSTGKGWQTRMNNALRQLIKS